MSASQPTIAATATAPGRGGVGVIRLSSENLLSLARTLSGGKTSKPHIMLYTDLLGGDGQPIDDSIPLYFIAPTGSTGEDVVELQGHGGLVMMDMPLSRCLGPGAHMAQPGEFTRRAFLNNKLDLAQAENVADLTDASSKSAACMTLRPLKDAFSRHTHELVDGLITSRVLVETTPDFPEGDIDLLEAADACDKFQTLQGRLKIVLVSVERGAILREDMNVILIGVPNVSKPNLPNASADDDIATIADTAGITRDTVREQITLGGMPVHAIDTVDLHEINDVVEQIDIERSCKAVSETDVALTLIDPREGANAKTQATLNSLPVGLEKIEIHNKADLTGEPVAIRPDGLTQTGTNTVISLLAKIGVSFGLLKHALLQEVGWQGENESLFSARNRHLNILHEAEAELKNAAFCDNNRIEFLAEHLRLAQSTCSEITGEFTIDDLLGVIFSRFCIGK